MLMMSNMSVQRILCVNYFIVLPYIPKKIDLCKSVILSIIRQWTGSSGTFRFLIIAVQKEESLFRGNGGGGVPWRDLCLKSSPSALSHC